jgi:serine/threonine protein phosphatase PrpC
MGDTRPTTRPALAWGASTDTGQVRSENEDAYVAEPLVFGVADGMGGHQAGEVASALAVNIVRDRLGAGARNLDVVVAAVVEANASIFQTAQANSAQRGMGTTLTAIAVLRDDEAEDAYGRDADRLVLVNVGDSRTYVYRNGTLRRASIDHSYVQELVATGHITEAEARTHPRRNIVTRALGIEPTVRIDTWTLPLVLGDRYVLCSDGLVDEVPDHEIADILGGVDDPQVAADELVAMANRHGGRDNVTVIVVDVLVGANPPDPTTDLDGTIDWDRDVGDVEKADIAEPASALAVSDLDPGSDSAEVSAAAQVVEAPPTAPITIEGNVGAGAATIVQAAVVPKRRRITTGAFLFVLALLVIVAATITLVAVAVHNSDNGPAPATSTTIPATTVAPSTTSPVSTTSAPSTTGAATTTLDITSTTSAFGATPTTAPG